MILKFTMECCKCFSMTKNNTINHIFRVYMIIGTIVTVVGVTLSLFATDEIRYLTQIVGFVFCLILGCIMQVPFLIHKKLLIQIINRVLGVHFSYPHYFIPVDKNITQIAERKAKEKSMVEILVYILTSSLWMLCPYLYLITKREIGFNHPDVQIVPYYYQIWKTNSLFSFVFKKCTDIIISLPCIFAYYLFTIFISYTIINLELHAEEINCRLNDIIERHVNKYMRFNELSISPIQKCSCFVFEQVDQRRRKCYEDSFKEEFVKIITYHNFIHSYTADVTKILHIPITAVFLWYLSATILFTYTLKVSSGSGDIIYFMKIFSLVVHCNVALRLYCNVAEIICQMNEKIMNSFYNTSWYYLQPKSRKNFLIILALCQRKYTVKCCGMYIVNLNFFIYAVRMVYSIMNVVLIVQNKNTVN